MSPVFEYAISRLNTPNSGQFLAFIDLFLAILLIVCFFFYIRKFPVFRVVLGIAVLYFCTYIFSISGFVLTSWVFGAASVFITISFPLIFAPEIRHYLEKIGRFSFIKVPHLTDKQKKSEFIKNLINTTYELAEKKLGATMVIQRKTGLGETIETGIIINAQFSSKLLESIFIPKSPLHDGAVVIRNGRIIAAKCLLPIHGDIKLDSPFGTRHKSGLAITKDTDAIVVIISEQRGEVSLAENGRLHINLNRSELNQRLNKLLN